MIACRFADICRESGSKASSICEVTVAVSQSSTPPLSELPTGCPMHLALKFLSREWTAHIVWLLGRNGETRFLQLQRALPGRVSARTLSQRLKQLEAMGLISRQDAGTMPPRVVYDLTDEGRSVDAMLSGIERWANAATLPAALTAS